jgi:hypothetical protein
MSWVFWVGCAVQSAFATVEDVRLCYSIQQASLYVSCKLLLVALGWYSSKEHLQQLEAAR